MWCVKCQKELGDCTCPDINERLASLAASPHFVYRACLRCGKHYARCKCIEPAWGLSSDLKAEGLVETGEVER